jgi:hypothetical protein
VRLDEAALDAYTDQFKLDALRVETRTFYEVPSDEGDFARYLADEPEPDPAVTEPWHAWIRAQLARGATVRRLRVLHSPPGDYLRFEMEWGYIGNAAAGEDIRILDLEYPRETPYPELWLLDDERVAFLRYDDVGRFLYADTDDPAFPPAAVYVACVMAWEAAEPFVEWWVRHPEYHRANRRARRSA